MCPKCKIRYCLSDERWECLQMPLHSVASDYHGTTCAQHVTGPDFFCDKVHLAPDQYTVHIGPENMTNERQTMKITVPDIVKQNKKR